LTWHGLIATVFGIGMSPRMPEALATAACLAVFLLTGGANIVFLAAAAVAGAIAADRYARVYGAGSREVVVGEAVGFWASMFGLDRTFALVGFFLFRVVSALRPFPAGYAEKLPGGFGVMAGGVCCGVIANVLLRALDWMFFQGGLDAAYKFFGIGG
jgi:phosphatidylglycerophosphatase A